VHPRVLGPNQIRAATVAVLLLLSQCKGNSSSPGLPIVETHRRAAELLQNERPYSARLSGSLHWSRCLSEGIGIVERCANYRPSATVLLQASADVRRLSGKDRRVSEWPNALVDLTAGPSESRLAGIIDDLSEAAYEIPDNAELQNDLGVAYLAGHDMRGDAMSLLFALEHIAHAHALDPSSPTATFNYALVLERLHLFGQAAKSWALVSDRARYGEWGKEAAIHLTKLTATSGHPKYSSITGDVRAEARRDPQGARELVLDDGLQHWADACLADDAKTARQAVNAIDSIGAALAEISGDSSVLHIGDELHLASPALVTAVLSFVKGSHEFRQRDYTAAARRLVPAERSLRRAGYAELADWALIPTAAVEMFRARYDLADSLYFAVVKRSASRDDKALNARAVWGAALSAARQGRFTQALDGYRRAAALFSELGERTNHASMLSQTADVLFSTGQDNAAVEAKLASLNELDARREPTLRHGALLSLGRQLDDLELQFAAVSVLAEAVRSATEVGAVADAAEARLRLVEAELIAGMRESARKDLAQAVTAAQKVTDSLMRPRLEMELSSVGALSLADSNPALAIRNLDSVSRFFADRRLMFDLPISLFRAAKLRIANGDSVLGRQDLDQAASILESQTPSQLDRNSIRAMAASRRDIYHAQLSLALARHDTIGALLVAERSRGHPIVAVPRVQPGLGVVEYAVLPDRLVLWWIGGSTVRMVQTPIDGAQLGMQLQRFESAIRRGDDPVAQEAAGRRLYDLLLGPVEQELANVRELMVIPDDPLTRTPFAALINTRGQYLVEVTTLSYASQIRGNWRTGTVAGQVGVISNPRFDQSLFPELSPLAAAAQEGAVIHSIYPRSVFIRNQAATKTAVLTLLRTADVVHFAGHARLVERVPSASHLVLARQSGGLAANSLSAAEIQRLDLRRLRLVVLSSCGTGQPGQTRREPTENGLASAFLNAGAAAVVSSTWEVDDDATANLMETFHRRIGQGAEPATALRDAQIEILKKTTAASIPRDWSGFRVERP
jgi:CHAT domain-containing protein